MIVSRRSMAAVALALTLGGLSVFRPGAVLAQDYPTRTVKIIVPFGAGGPADVFSRVLAQHLSDALKEPFIVEDRPGAGSIIGTDAVAKSPPDGYTLLAMSNTHTTNESLIANKPFQLMRDFVPVAGINYSDLVMVIHPSVPAKDLKEFIAYAKSKPGELNYASSGTGTPYHMAAELFKAMSGTDLVHVPHKASGEMRNSVIGGHVQMAFDAITTMAPNVKAGQVRALGTSAAKRSSVLPDVPTIAEAGVPGYESTIWLGIMAPAGTPKAIVDKLNAEINKVITRPDVKAAWNRQGAVPLVMTPGEFETYLRADIEKWAQVVKTAGLRPDADVTLAFKTASFGAALLMPPINWLDQINAQKDFKLTVEGPEDLSNWFAQTIMMSQSVGLRIGTRLADGTMRYCNMTNGGPVFVYVKDGKIVRMTPINFGADDPQPWTIEARGLKFTPPRKTTLAPHGQNAKSIVYSPDRLLYPMKRVDFDPSGERNPQNRGKSGYVRISWEEALDLVAGEIKRLKRTYGPGVMAVSHGSHHTWGNIGYYLSALFRFRNAVGYTQIHHNPDSWEGWYWGAVHHWGYTLRVGQSETYGTVEDCLQNCDMIVFWAADPESTSGSYGAQEGTVRRQWLKNPKLGIKVVHVDPYYNASAQFLPGKWFAPRPTTSVAMAMAIAYVWIKEDLYDKAYVETHTVGFDKWKAYLLGEEDGIAKTPEWQEKETGVPAKDVRALAREWGKKRVYLAPGGWGNGHGGACRNQTGIQWARVMVCLTAMQGLGKPGVNMGNLQWGCPLDFQFHFRGS